MKHDMMTRTYQLAALLWLTALAAVAQKVHVYAPPTVRTGEQFAIVYEVNTQDVQSPHIGSARGLRLLAGPFVSQQSSFQVVNGHASSSSSVSFTYYFEATRHGQVAVPAFHVTAGGRKLNAQAVRLNIVGQDEDDEPARQQHPSQQSAAPTAPQTTPSTPTPRGGATAKSADDDLFITVTASRKRVLEQEPVLLTYKVYTRLDLSQLVGRMPDVKGAHTQEVKLPQQKSLQSDTYNGQAYRSTVWVQYVVYPQTTGTLHIPAIPFQAVVQEQDRSFMSMGGYNEEKRTITAPGIDIHVDPLPAKPKTFAGGVGRFSLSMQPVAGEVKAGDPLTLRLVIGGQGNLKLIQKPRVTFPKGFDQYDTKVTDKTRLTAAGVEGNMVYDYVAVPRKEGQYTIPAVEWTYYDTQQRQYRTLRTKPVTLRVAKGSGQDPDAADYSAQKLDIRPLCRDAATVRSLSDAFYGSPFHLGALGLLGAAFVALLLRFHRLALERADIVKMRGKRAGKMADRRLRKARRLMQRGRADRFYNEVLRALWGYVSDRLNMKREQLSRDNIAEKLAARTVSTDIIDTFIRAIDECEFERYAPGDARGNMSRTIDAASAAITSIEEALAAARRTSRAQQSGYTVSLLLPLMLFSLLSPLSSLPSQAMTKQNGDQEYARGNYTQAIADYQAVLRTDGPSAEVYYNLGNACYRADRLPQAILAYERALRLRPGYSDARFNLELARTKTIDKFAPEPELFITTWTRWVVNLGSADQWAVTSIVSLAAVIALVLLFLFARRLAVRKAGFYAGVAALLVFAVAMVCGYAQQSALENRRGAVITAPTVSVRKTPATTAEETLVVHEGTRVDIEDRSMSQWRQVRLPDGREGWVLTRQLEEI